MTKEEIEDQLKNLKLLLEFHSKGYIKDPTEFENHINSILDEVEKLEKELKK